MLIEVTSISRQGQAQYQEELKKLYGTTYG